MIIEGKELIIKRYEFNEYLEVNFDGNDIIIPYNKISYFLSNEMTNHLLNEVKETDYIYLYNFILSLTISQSE